MKNQAGVEEQDHFLPKPVSSQLETYLENKFEGHILPFGCSKDHHADPQKNVNRLWEDFEKEKKDADVFPFLQKNWITWKFPIQEGISQKPVYRLATAKGQLIANQRTENPGLKLQEPDALQFFLYKGLAGDIPVLVCSNKADFDAIIQALAYKNEPKKIPPSMGASLIKGITNWSRIKKLKKAYLQDHPNLNWTTYFNKEILPKKPLYQDQLIILSDHPYSGVEGDEFGINKARWREISLKIRLEHECTHLFTQKFLGGMYVNMHDELIADYMGITKAVGTLKPEWFLAFLGLEKKGYRKGARLENYLGKGDWTKAEFAYLQDLLRKCATQLGLFSEKIHDQKSPESRKAQLLSLASLSLGEIGSPNGSLRLLEQHQRFIP